ncbi:MAG: hypothetical protein BGO41_04605 [Clostridiales bacterium 38-18]|nr:MAG: hypothetical protein BGO41_04605 [Clostridiales bacterium 38-18]
MGLKYEREYQLNYFDFDKNYQIKPATLMNFLQDISTRHFEEATREVPCGDLPGIWVIVEWDIKKSDVQLKAGMIKVVTEPIYFRKFIAYRCYEVYNHENELVLTGYSKWAYIDSDNRKQVNIPRFLNTLFHVEADAEKPEKLSFNDLSEIESYSERNLQAVYTDLDVNKHVNNITYIRWAIDSLGSAYMDGHKFSELKVAFKREVFEDQRIKVLTKIKETATETVSEHLICDHDDQLLVQVVFSFI